MTTLEEASDLSDCGRGCFVIGGPFITYDPGCPMHGDYARQRAKLEEQKLDERRASDEAIAAPLAAWAKATQEYRDDQSSNCGIRDRAFDAESALLAAYHALTNAETTR